MKHSINNGIDRFLLMPPAYYKYDDDGAYLLFLQMLFKKFLKAKLFYIILKNLVVISLALILLKN